MREMMELRDLLAEDGWQVPESRRSVRDIGDVQWLRRNVGIANAGHPDLPRVQRLVRFILRVDARVLTTVDL